MLLVACAPVAGDRDIGGLRLDRRGRTRHLKHADARSQPLQLAEDGGAPRLVLGSDALHVLQKLVVEARQRVAQRLDERFLVRRGLGNSDVHFFELLQQRSHYGPLVVLPNQIPQ